MWVKLVLGVIVMVSMVRLVYRRVAGRCSSTRRLDGKTVIVTGSSAGIGKAAALDFAKRGARVILACRNLVKAGKVADEIILSSGNSNVEVRQLDTSDLGSVRHFAKGILQSEEYLHVLVNNAGMAGNWSRASTKDGLELTMATNYYGHFLLTNLLLGLLKTSAPSRIINVTSLMHKFCSKLDPEDLNFEKMTYHRLMSYNQSKLCNILFTEELSDKLKGTSVTVNSVHPGAVDTEINIKGRSFPTLVAHILFKLMAKVRIQTALNQPLVATRCEEVARILSEATTKDAGYILRATVESILGLSTPSTLQGYLGWGLRVITRSAQPREFEQLRAFLGPNGPLLALIFRLASDPYMAFEFPVAWLPAKSRIELEEGSPSAFYANKVQYPGPGKAPVNILLNAFEYYLFHFAHFLVGGSSSISSGNINSSSGSNNNTSGGSSGMGQRWTLTWSTAGDALYPTLLEEYLTAFLPCDGSLPPGPPSPPVSPRGVLAARPGCSGNTNLYLSGLAASPITPRPLHPHGQPHHSFSEVVGGIGGIVGGMPHTSSPLHLHQHHNHHSPVVTSVAALASSPHGTSQPGLSVWTSQVLVQVFIEMWVNQCVVPNVTTRTASAPRPNHPIHHLTTPVPATQEVFVPTSDHVRVVRMLVKHLHFFANSGKSAQPSPLDSLRKNLWNLYRKSVYQFLVHTFKHWPLDSSFRLVLETWLSYIQPWRYCDYSPSTRSPTTAQTTSITENESRSVEGRWQGFVAENLLFYSLLFHHLLLRLFRLDLSAPRNAQILFRVTKVFSQPNLSRYIQEIESALDDPHLIHRSLLGPTSAPTLSHKNLGTGGLGGDARSLASLARSHCVEMEGLGHSYQPMFGAASVSLINSLMKHVRSAYEAVYSEQQQQQQTHQQSALYTDRVGHKAGWWSCFIRSLFESSITSDEESSAEDMRKTIVHLEMAQRHLSGMFGIPVPLELSCHDNAGNDSYQQHHPAQLERSYHALDPSTSPDHVKTPDGPVLTAYGRQQLRCGLRRRDLKYEGDPDLRPISSYEFACLVRWLYTVCLLLNTRYRERMAAAYHRQDVIGWIARRLLQGPETIFEYHKDVQGAPPARIERHLPPRVSLRTQASKRVLGYEVALIVLLHLLGLWGLVLRLFIATAILISVVGYLIHRYIHSYHTTNTAVTTTASLSTPSASSVKSMVSSPGL